MTDSFEITTEKMAFEGLAIGRQNRFVVFVEGALPGERVRVVPTKKKRQFSFARVTEVLEASPHRIAPPCPVFGACGGCTFLHCAYPAQLDIKREVLRESLYGVPGVEDKIAPVQGMEPPFHFRNKMVFSFGLEDGQPVLGMHRRGSFHRIVSAETCLLPSPTAGEIIRRTLAWARDNHLPAFDELKKTGLLRDMMVREGKHTGERMVQFNVTARHPAFDTLADRLGDLCDTLILGYDTNIAGPPRPGEWQVLKGRGFIRDRLNRFTFDIHPQTFFQTNTLQAEKMFATLAEWAGSFRPRCVLDLYAGTGPIAMHVSGAAEQVLAIEASADSVAAAEKILRDNGIGNVRMVCANLDKSLPDDLPAPVDLVIVDPPRPGLHELTLKKILAMSPANVFYVSCNPATLARDLKILAAAGYGICRIQPLDMFPHTFHLETLVWMSKAS